MRFPGHEGESTPIARAAALRAQIKEAVVDDKPGVVIAVDLQAAACFFGIGAEELARLGEQDQHLKMAVDPRESTMSIELAISPLDMTRAARFLVGLVAAEQMNYGTEYLAAAGPASRYLLNRIRGLSGAVAEIGAGQSLDDLTLNLLELQVYSLITAGNLDVPLPNLARAAAGR